MTDKSPKLIFINGPVGVGKSTLAQKYIENHKLALLLSADDFVGSMGGWLENEDTARDLALEYILLIAERHLKAGFDVVIPYLLANPKEMEQVEQVVDKSSAILFEFALIASKEEAVARALERGSWGEPGAPPLTQEDEPKLKKLYDCFNDALHTRQKAIQIIVEKGNIEGTYRNLVKYVDNSLL